MTQNAPESTAPDAEPAVDPALLEIVVCPDCRGELALADAPKGGTELVCQSCGLAYPVRDGIPVLLVDEARRPA